MTLSGTVRLAAAGLLAITGCQRPTSAPAQGATGADAVDGGPGTPVKTALIERATVPLLVTAPGHTDALEQQKIRAPFKGTLVRLLVADGDHVQAHQVVAELVSQDSEAALVGAEALLTAAQSPPQRLDGERAVELARRGLVRAQLRAPKAGVVVSHGADEGSLVSEAQDLIALAVSSTFFFRAELVQTELPRIRAGEGATVRLASVLEPLRGVVHGILPAASPTDLSAPVRIDFVGGSPERLGLFGTVTINVGEHAGVLVVPTASLLRDDVSGIQRLALVKSGGRAHWEVVTTGVESGGRTEVSGPTLAPGQAVIVAGQVGLPEGARVEVE
jgi:multidrug efflux pump subunit AcrA (membrane-fusion protein)